MTAPSDFGCRHDLDHLLRLLADRIGPDVGSIARDSADTITAEVAAYGISRDPLLQVQLYNHSLGVFRALVSCLHTNRSPAAADFPATPEFASSRVQQGIGLHDFLRAFRIGHITFWRRLVATIAEMDDLDPRCRDRDIAAILTRTGELLLEVIELVSSDAGSAYLEAEQFRLADGERMRRDLIEDLLAGRRPIIGPRRALLNTAGLTAGAPFVATSTRLPDGIDDSALTRIRSLMRTAVGRGGTGLIVARHDEVIGLFPTADPAEIVARFVALRPDVDTPNSGIATGISTVHHDWDFVAQAHREATVTRDSIGPDGPGTDGAVTVRAATSLSPIDYLLRADDTTAYRLIDPRITAFVREEVAGDRVYLDTLEAYVESDLNAKVAAERLHLHVNTAYYRLERIAERTGRDLRRFTEVMDLIVAVRLLRSGSPGSPTAERSRPER
ncbi:PucR family transcriptional regulator [Millisia brevis]|uniref:PucR family transcriptional regulator n=1 Tax=Millisia brevis TaxID=264148 RepID=UPI00082F22B7|nr:helix-turn-helix domain-containing protein [Millisia brevis]